MQLVESNEKLTYEQLETIYEADTSHLQDEIDTLKKSLAQQEALYEGVVSFLKEQLKNSARITPEQKGA